MISIKDYRDTVLTMDIVNKKGELQLLDLDAREYITIKLNKDELTKIMNYINESIGTEPSVEPYTSDMINHILILSLRFLTEDQRKILIYNLQERIGKLPEEE